MDQIADSDSGELGEEYQRVSGELQVQYRAIQLTDIGPVLHYLCTCRVLRWEALYIRPGH